MNTMIYENMIGTMSKGNAESIVNGKPLFDLLTSGEYKDFIIPNYFPEVSYMEEDDVLFMRSSLYVREDVAPAFYWYLTFSSDGTYMPEATSGYIALNRDSNLLHIKGMRHVSYNYMQLRQVSYEGIEIIGGYSMQSTDYTLSTNKSPITKRDEYDNDGALINIGTASNDEKVLYVPLNDTVPASVKSSMQKTIDMLNAGKLRLPEPY